VKIVYHHRARTAACLGLQESAVGREVEASLPKVPEELAIWEIHRAVWVVVINRDQLNELFPLV